MNQLRNPLEKALANSTIEKIDLQAILYPLWWNKWLIISISILCLMLGIFYSRVKIPMYTSNVLVQIEEHGNTLGLERELSALSLGTKSGINIDLQTALIKSRHILAPVVKQLGLDISVSPQYFPIIGNWYARRHANSYDKPTWVPERYAHYAWGGDNVEVINFEVPMQDENKKFNLVATGDDQFELFDTDGQFILKGKTGQIVEVILPERGKYTIQVNRLNAGVKTEFILTKSSTQKMVEMVANQLKINDLSIEMRLANVTGILKISMVNANPTYIVNVLNAIANTVLQKNTIKKSQEATKTLEFINQQLPVIKKSLNESETLLSNYLAKHGMIDLASESKMLLTMLTNTHKSLSLIKVEKDSALKKYTPAHPYIIALNEREKSYATEIGALQKKLSELPARDQVAVGLMRDIKVKSQLYLILLNKIQSLKVAKGGTVSDVSILGFAAIPDSPLPSGFGSIILFSLLGGLVIGAIYTYLQRIWNRKIIDPTVIETHFGLPNMAIIPFSEKQTQLLKSHEINKRPIPILAQLDARDLTIEALRSFRTSSQFAMIDSVSNIITITGVAPGVGKSFVSANFAFLHADAGKKVLLIDGDMRKGHLRDYFQADKTVGLSEVICGTCTLEEAVIQGPVNNLHFIATGTYPPNPSELLMKKSFKELLETASKQYDLIIIDTAPILAVTDAIVIAGYSAATFLVLASGVHETAEIELALKRVQSNGLSINGVVFNFSKQQKGLYKSNTTLTYQYQYDYK